MGFQPAVNLGQSETGLFTREEIARLMESEYRRSLRYDYPLALLCVEIDRLESLHDLYGVDSEQRILRAVAGLLRTSTRASDVLGLQEDPHLIVLVPHTTREGAVAIARRLLAGCRELEFRGDGRALRASLSIGIVSRGDDLGLPALMEQGKRALAASQAGGGDRYTEFERLPGAAAAPRAPQAPPAEARRAPAPPPRPPPIPVLPAVDQLPGSTLADKVHSLFALCGAGDDLAALEREVLSVLERTLGLGSRPRTRAEVLEEIRLTEERIVQQKRLLEASEEELARMIQEKSVDPGVASIYRSAQGLDPDTRDYARKKELLTVIYQANVELLKQLEKEAGER